MNMQMLMKQAQKMQKDLENTQKELENTKYEGSSSLVKVVVNGNKDLLSVKIVSDEDIKADELELLEDMLLVAVNDAFKKADSDKQKKLGKYGNLAGLMQVMYPNCLKNLIDCLRCLPGIGEKSAERLAFTMMNFDKDKLTFFANSILEVRDNIKRCSICNNITDMDVCSICSNDNRKKDIVFVVEKPKDVVLFEKINVYNGSYHILDGLISPLDGIGPDDINLNLLIERVESGSINEVILALKPSIEGETTMQYIKKLLSNKGVKITKIATGIPIGTDIEYIDSMTLEMSFEERKEIS